MDKFFFKHRLGLSLSVLFLCAIGAMLILDLPVSLYPNVNKPEIHGRVYYKNDIQEFKKLWGEKIETSLLNIEKVNFVASEYSDGQAEYRVSFEWSVKNQVALKEVKSVLDNFSSQLPRDVKLPEVRYFNPGTECYLAIQGDQNSAVISENLHDTLGAKLHAIDGVADYWISTVGEEDLVISLDSVLMAQYEISMTEVLNRIKFRLYDKVLGVEQVGAMKKIHIKLDNGVKTVDEIKNIALRQTTHDVVILSDVATVKYKKKLVTRELLLDGKPSVAVAVWPEPDANLRDVANTFFNTVEAELPPNFRIVKLNNPAKFIHEAITKVGFSVLLAMFSASLLVGVFFRSNRIALICLAVLPLSIAGSIIVMYLAGISINLLSVGAMSISAGMVIDSAIVIIDKLASGSSSDEAYSGAIKVAPAVLASILTTIAVFLPLAFTAPIASALLTDISVVVTSLMLFSMVISLILIPAIWHRLFNQERFHRFQLNKKSKITNIYGNLLQGIQCRRSVQLGIIAFCLVISSLGLWAANNTRVEILADPLPEIIDVEITFNNLGLDDGMRKLISEKIRKEINDKLKDKVRLIYSDIRESVAYLSLHLTSYQKSEEVLSILKNSLKDTSAYKLTYEPWITASLKIPNPPDVQILVSGASEHERREKINQVVALVKKQGDSKKIRTRPTEQMTKTNLLNVDRRMLNGLIDSKDLDAVVDDILLYSGAYIERKYIIDSEIDGKNRHIYYDVNKNEAHSLDSLLYTRDGKLMHIGDLVDVEQTNEWKYFYSRDGKPQYEINVWLEDNSESSVKKFIKNIKVAAENEIRNHIFFKDERKEVKEAIASLNQMLLFSLVLIFIIILYLFKRITYSLIILLAVPIALCGAVLALYLFKSTLSLNSMIGMVMLCGMAVNNGILFLNEYLKQIVFDDVDRMKASRIAACSRLNAIMITTLTSIVGLVPIILGMGAGGEILQPLGISLMGGLLVSCFYSLLIIPLLVRWIPVDKNNEMKVVYDV